MRGALIHVFTGLALGVALAGLLHAPTELIAQQEARTPVVQPKAATAGPWSEEQTVRLSPKVERELERQRVQRLSPKTVLPPRPLTTPGRPILVGATEPVTPDAPPASQPDRKAEKPKPKPPKPTDPPESAPAPGPPPEVVTPSPQPVYTPASDEGKKSKKSKKQKKQKKPKKDKAEKQDKHETKDKADKKDKAETSDHVADGGHDEGDKHKKTTTTESL